MERLTARRAAAAGALAVGGLAAAAAVYLPAAFQPAAQRGEPGVRRELLPRTHLFAQPVTATLDVPHESVVATRFDPYRVIRRSVTPDGRNDHYAFVIDCIQAACIGDPGDEREFWFPPARVQGPRGRAVFVTWPPLREASRIPATAVTGPRARDEFRAAAPRPARRELAGHLLTAGAALAVLAAAFLACRWLRPQHGLISARTANGRSPLSDLEYALVVTGLAAGGEPQDRRAALEALAVALDDRGLGDLAAQARTLAWSPRAPNGPSVRRLARAAQEALR
jgi:hypothetical protein